jgi:mRNA interferase MazF
MHFIFNERRFKTMYKLIKRFDLVLVNLHHAYGAEMRKIRPCIIISPNELHYLKTCIVAPLTKIHHEFSSRVPTRFHDLDGEIALDQLRAIDLARIVSILDKADDQTQDLILEGLSKLFGK